MAKRVSAKKGNPVAVVLDMWPFPTDHLHGESHNLTLGRFMTAWSQIEIVCRALFQAAIHVDDDQANIIFDNVSAKDQIIILRNMVSYLTSHDGDDGEKLARLLDEVKVLSTTRNRIIHARWGSLHGEIARFWFGITADQVSLMVIEGEGAASCRTKIFTVPEITAATERCAQVGEGLSQQLSNVIRQQMPQRVRRLISGSEFD